MAPVRSASLVLAVVLGLASAVGCKSDAGFDPGPVREALAGGPAEGVEMFALRVGTSPAAPRKYFIADPDLPEQIPVGFWFWALKTAHRLILIDCGFVDPARAKQWGIGDWRSPAKLLAEAGLSPSAVTDLVITHGHWDHIGGLGLFPKARVWIDPRELAAATAEAKRVEPALGRVLEALTDQPRLRKLTRVQSIAPGVVAFPTGLHAAGAWAVAVRASDKVWVFASDEVPLYSNLRRRIPSGQTSAPDRSRALFEGLLGLVGSRIERILPGHEPALAERFERIGDRVVRIGP